MPAKRPATRREEPFAPHVAVARCGAVFPTRPRHLKLAASSTPSREYRVLPALRPARATSKLCEWSYFARTGWNKPPAFSVNSVQALALRWWEGKMATASGRCLGGSALRTLCGSRLGAEPFGEPDDRQRVCQTQQLPPDAERVNSRRRPFSTNFPATWRTLGVSISPPHTPHESDQPLPHKRPFLRQHSPRSDHNSPSRGLAPQSRVNPSSYPDPRCAWPLGPRSRLREDRLLPTHGSRANGRYNPFEPSRLRCRQVVLSKTLRNNSWVVIRWQWDDGPAIWCRNPLWSKPLI